MNEPHPLGTLTADDFRRVRDIFESALNRPVGERRGFVERACDGNTLFVAEVERMLAGNVAPHRLFDRHDGDQAASEFRGRRRDTLARASDDRAVDCPVCKAPVSIADRFCRACGSATTAGAFEEEGRFRAGALFAGRFRIVAALGRGGMGEVYRAHDLELGQPVALKFLTAWRSDDRARARLRGEVRLARQIAHPNVCRVYDIGEAQGDLYLSMEYVDGEDLAALLKRIGRVPVDKGIEIARKLCAGLAAAHAKGVLHRDFKPANIMVDSRGEVRIMDFGLATAAEHLDATEVRSGTPAYMAPEQLAGREATLQSDLYALGLVLYELFTGKLPFPATDLQELQRQRTSHPSTTPSTLIPDLGPRVERAILRCLEPDPKLRPASALDISASLPGGDPLADALAAGETPSPEMVAAAGSTDALRPATAIALLACIGLGLTGAVLLAPRAQALGRLPLKYSPEVLTQKARDIVEQFGDSVHPADTAAGFRGEEGWLKSVSNAMPVDATRTEWNRRFAVAPYPVSFWYRQSDAPLLPRGPVGRVAPPERFQAMAGNVAVELDLDGRLLSFSTSPVDSAGVAHQGSRLPTWPDFFDAAHLNVSEFTPVEPELMPSGPTDTRIAWQGFDPGPTKTPLRVEGAAYKGHPVSFNVIFPWTASTAAPNLAPAPQPWPVVILGVTLLLFACFFARRNWKAGRSDTRGASIVALFTFATADASLLLSAHEAFYEVGTQVFLQGFNAWLWYLAFEPWVRRRWPQALVTTSRVLAGRWRDPVVGRDVLIGVLAGVGMSCVRQALYYGFTPAGALNGSTTRFALDQLMGARFVAATTSFAAADSIRVGLVMFFILFVCRVTLRKPALATVGYLVVMAAFSVPSLTQGPWVGSTVTLIINGLSVLIMLRFGLLALTTWAFFGKLIDYGLVTTSFGEWYGESSLVVVVILGAVALWAFRTSLGGRSIFAAPPAGV